MDLFDLLLYKSVAGDSGGGGGGEISTQSINISANGTYRAPSGKAYTPVNVNVPNTYGAADEGKVVSNGSLVSQTDDTTTENGVVDTTTIKQLTVAVPVPTLESKNIDANGTYTPESGKAWNSVVVSVPAPVYPIAENNSFGGGS